VTTHGKSTDQNQCTSALNPPISQPSELTIPVTFETDAFPHPHQGNPIELTNTKVTLAVPADLLQAGVALGIVKDGTEVPSEITVVIQGDNTTEGTQTFTVNVTAIVSVINGEAQPLSAPVDLPPSTWHPADDQKQVDFREKAVTVVATIDARPILGFVTATFTCVPSAAPAFVQVGAQSATVAPDTTTTLPPQQTAGATTTTVAAAASTGSDTLPRTGMNALIFLVIAAGLIDAGIALLATTRRRAER
jgi:hypothetical protein